MSSDQPRPAKLEALVTTVSTQHLPVGGRVYTTQIRGDDFGLPLVEPNLKLRDRVVRTVRNHVKCQGGHVVWFTDGTKTSPLHGRAAWRLAGPVNKPGFVDWYEDALGYDPEHDCCPDCGCDPLDHTIHATGCRRLFPEGHEREYLQFGPPWAAWPEEK